MNTPCHRLISTLTVGATLTLGVFPAVLHAQAKKPNPASKLYVSDVSGDAQIDTGESIEDLTKRSVYNAQGTVIETKRPEREQDRSKNYSTMVYSNGTGAFFDADTRVEVRRFVQEPFTPTRADLEVEPSISQTQAFVARGTVGLCTSKLVAGSTMSYATPHGSVNINGGKVVIQVADGVTKISMVEGESTVRAGTMDMGGHTVHVGEQAVIRAGAAGQPNIIEIQKIPQGEAGQLDDKVSMACMAKRTVYFDVRGRQNEESAQGGANGGAFNGENAEGAREIIAVPLIPTNLPVQFTVSPATLTTPSGNIITPGQGSPPGR